ncbi:hypothetical protein DFR49_2785 [Hephaestia caeni]|uniref:Uncharacterized protein n=1 Tax=Hephaestia caeni TaxID=645617 RepID=A0A397P4S5_9SPHN|nr:hypothetical protein [Hephaestia caeni]RIA44540.1 hypothetical protein DFR49_2785 [Hephaestia caeni]
MHIIAFRRILSLVGAVAATLCLTLASAPPVLPGVPSAVVRSNA